MTVLVIGATGELGSEVARALVARGFEVRAMSRRAPGRGLDGIWRIVQADLRDPSSLTAAFGGVRRVFLVSSPTKDQVEVETNAIVAAETAGVEHVVKVSNLPVAGLDSGLHGNHRAVERRLARRRSAPRCCSPRSSCRCSLARSTCSAAGAWCCRLGPGRSRGSIPATSPRSPPRCWPIPISIRPPDRCGSRARRRSTPEVSRRELPTLPASRSRSRSPISRSGVRLW